MHDESPQRPDGDWAWEWEQEPDSAAGATDPLGVAPTVPAPQVRGPRASTGDTPRLATWSRPLAIVGSAALATAVALILMAVPLRIELPTGGNARRPDAPRPATGGIVEPREPARSEPSTTTATIPAPPATQPAAPPRGTITRVPPSSAPTAPPAPPPSDQAPPPGGPPRDPPDDRGDDGPLDELLP